MNIYLVGILASLVLFFAVGILAGRRVKSTNDYYVAGRNAPTVLVVGSLIASFLSTGAFLGDTGEVYSGFFMGIVIVGVIQATGYIYGAGFFGRYIRRSQASTLPEYFGSRFDSPALKKLSSLILIVSVSAYLLSAIQGVATLISSITGLDYSLCTVIVWLAFTAFTIYSGSPGVLLTDTIMFLVFLTAALVAVPFIVHAAGGWFGGIAALANCESMPGIISWSGNLGYLYPDGVSNLAWALTYGLVWALVVSVSPWQTSRYLMARDEHVVMRSSIWSSMGVMVVTIALYFTAAFVRNINGSLPGNQALIWAAMNVLPPVIGIVMLTGISAAGISSASTFLSLVGFSLVNDIMPDKGRDDRKKLRLSRLTMLAASLVILVLAYFNPPQIFVIMYFGGTVIASSWSLAAFGSVWSKKLSKTGAFWGMLLGFLGCVVSKILYSALGVTPPVILDPFFIGIALSLIGAVLGSVLRPVSAGEEELRAALFRAPASALDERECRKDHRLWIVYLLFGIALGAFFLLMYALPYCRAVG
ncbi:MAG: sodium:solute symporter [Candidatus Limivicinus sp.]